MRIGRYESYEAYKANCQRIVIECLEPRSSSDSGRGRNSLHAPEQARRKLALEKFSSFLRSSEPCCNTQASCLRRCAVKGHFSAVQKAEVSPPGTLSFSSHSSYSCILFDHLVLLSTLEVDYSITK